MPLAPPPRKSRITGFESLPPRRFRARACRWAEAAPRADQGLLGQFSPWVAGPPHMYRRGHGETCCPSSPSSDRTRPAAPPGASRTLARAVTSRAGGSRPLADRCGPRQPGRARWTAAGLGGSGARDRGTWSDPWGIVSAAACSPEKPLAGLPAGRYARLRGPRLLAPCKPGEGRRPPAAVGLRPGYQPKALAMAEAARPTGQVGCGSALPLTADGPALGPGRGSTERLGTWANRMLAARQGRR